MSVDQGDDGLFVMDSVEPPVVVRGPVDKTFRPFRPDQMFLAPPSLDQWLPQNHLARFIADLVDEHLDSWLSCWFRGSIHPACRPGRSGQ